MIYEEYTHNQRSSLPEEDMANLKLWAHVFALGLRDFALDQEAVEAGRFPQEPSYWFWSHANATGSFEWLCDLLKVDPERARTETLSKWRDLLPGGAISKTRTMDKKD